VEVDKFFASDVTEYALFGQSVSNKADSFLIESPKSGQIAGWAGSAYLFKFESDVWTEQSYFVRQGASRRVIRRKIRKRGLFTYLSETLLMSDPYPWIPLKRG